MLREQVFVSVNQSINESLKQHMFNFQKEIQKIPDSNTNITFAS